MTRRTFADARQPHLYPVSPPTGLLHARQRHHGQAEPEDGELAPVGARPEQQVPPAGSRVLHGESDL